MTEIQKFVAIPKRPLWLAEQVLAATAMPTLVCDPMTIGDAPLRPDDVSVGPRINLGGRVPVVLDAVSDWWDERGNANWPDPILEPMGRLPWPHVWCEWVDHGAGGPSMRLPDGSSRGHKVGAVLSELQPAEVVREIKRWVRASRTLDELDAVNDVIGRFASASVVIGCQVVFDAVTPMGPGLPSLMALPRFYQPIDHNGNAGLWPNGSYVIVQEPMGPPNHVASDNLQVWRLFTALLRVKNIDTTDVQIPRAQRRRLSVHVESKGPPPWISYKTLTVLLPPTRNGPRGSARFGLPSPVPFHLVRGHLADYRDGSGLFGRWKSVIWKPMHHRGYQQVGAVAKTYEAEMRPPDGAS